ncbi:MAG TPA: tetratricopeptide repeat protein [Terriglobales bacterium]|nr:tetratricopeptide repeat protein [Terriglobales bacterium]
MVGLAAQVPVHHPIATGSPTAQAAFDRGLALVYAFNFRAAEAAFRQASAKDPTEPMPYWGLALALGPNLNARQPSPAAARNATDALAKARELAASLPEDAEGAEERGYIEALTLRLSCDPHPAYLHLESAYGEAMQRLAATYPSDPDAATLYAESLMEQRGWRAWIHGGGSSLPSGEVLAALARVLQRWPDHLGANHLYIHATDGAGHPERALESAAVLERLGAAFPGDGHLLHMPAHVYLRLGRFAEAERASVAAAGTDRAYLGAHPEDSSYAGSYYLHNLRFLAYAASMSGDFPAARKAAQELVSGAQRFESARGEHASDSVAFLAVLVRFARWQDILATPQPDDAALSIFPGRSGPRSDHRDADSNYAYYWHFARASALAAAGNVSGALEQTQHLRAPGRSYPPTLAPRLPSPATSDLAALLAAARVNIARHRWAEAIAELRNAVSIGDSLPAADPPPWYPVRETLGATLLLAGRSAEAAQVFRDALARIPGDPRALYGLWQSLLATGDAADAARARQEFTAAWKGGPLAVRDF